MNCYNLLGFTRFTYQFKCDFLWLICAQVKIKLDCLILFMFIFALLRVLKLK